MTPPGTLRPEPLPRRDARIVLVGVTVLSLCFPITAVSLAAGSGPWPVFVGFLGGGAVAWVGHGRVPRVPRDFIELAEQAGWPTGPMPALAIGCMVAQIGGVAAAVAAVARGEPRPAYRSRKARRGPPRAAPLPVLP